MRKGNATLPAAPPENEKYPGGVRNFAYGEYSRALRLASELADLRAANADRIFAGAARKKRDPTEGGVSKNEKSTPVGCF